MPSCRSQSSGACDQVREHKIKGEYRNLAHVLCERELAQIDMILRCCDQVNQLTKLSLERRLYISCSRSATCDKEIEYYARRGKARANARSTTRSGSAS